MEKITLTLFSEGQTEIEVDRGEYEAAKAAGELAEFLDVYTSDIETDETVQEPDGTVITVPDGNVLPAPSQTPVHDFFGLSYASHHVVNRTLAQSMPVEWQHRFVEVMKELQAAFVHVLQPSEYEVRAGEWLAPGECSPFDLAGAGVVVREVDGELAYEWRGRDVAPGERIFVPGMDLVPHYNRGRTRVEPKVSA